ncbi:helix-turn-helix domain-containing protein [Poritiphilus flavus]|uniref:Helix-turn-helix domain-containing protein n=1 Tax=Poritiphilus flavus TaxID=2697053 RepID=A0A6L9E8H6_9FLAO|nr:helix-turn-helix transcriptional regulator [Poritiphilus flavus]NAS10903.1 helix-turn-helix domain-containing protein [Poritiphilus flavus]
MFILKQLRRKKSISQTNLAEAIGVSLRTIQLYERKGANIPIKNLTKIAQYFEMSIAELYMYEVNETDGKYNGKPRFSSKGQQVQQVGLGKYQISVPLISGEQQRAYCKNLHNKDYINGLSHIGFVIEEVQNSSYAAFEITNNSMDNGKIGGIPNKAIVLGKLVPGKKFPTEWLSRPNHPWILVTLEGILCKSIIAYDKEGGKLKCHNLNPSPEYTDFELNMENLEQLFLVVRKQLN